jgi:tape measure domain-containing protein
MATMVERIIVEVSLDSRQFNTQTKQLGNNISSFGAKVETVSERTSKSFKSFLSAGKIALLALAAAAVKATHEIIQIGDKFDQVRRKLEFASGSSQAAAQNLQFVANISERLGIDLIAASEGFANLSAAAKGTALEGEGIQKVFSGVSDAVAALSLSADDTKGIMRALTQIMSGATVQGDELNQLAERIPGFFNIAARSMGSTTEELKKMKEAGKLASKDFIVALSQGLKREFGPSAQEAGNSVQGATKRMRNQFTLLAIEMNELIKPFRAFIVNGISQVVKWFRGFASENGPAFIKTLQNIASSALRTAVPAMITWGRFIWSVIKAMTRLGLAVANSLGLVNDSFDGSSNFVIKAVELFIFGMFKAIAVMENFEEVVNNVFLNVKKIFQEGLQFITVGIVKVDKELRAQLMKSDKRLAKIFENADNEAIKLIETFEDMANELKSLTTGTKKIDIKGGVPDLEAKVKVDSVGTAAGAIEAGSVEAFKILAGGNKELEKDQKRTAKAAEETAKNTKNLKKLDGVTYDVATGNLYYD